MRTTSRAGRLAACGLAATLAGLLLAISAGTASAADGVARASDKANGVQQTSHAEPCATTSCSNDGACSNGSCCGCKGKPGFIGKLFGKKCSCGKGCGCSKGGCKGCGNKCDLNGDGIPDPIGDGICRECGAHGSLYGHGYCGSCCGHKCGIPIPCCFGIPVPGCFASTGGALGGCYGRVYAVNPYYHDPRDGAIYAAQGYGAPIAVPLAPNVDFQWNYGWGIPSSRITPISRVVPSTYAVPPTFTVPPGYAPGSDPALTVGSVLPPAPAQ